LCRGKMINQLLEKLIQRKDLSAAEAYQLMCRIMEGELKESQVAACLVALRCKGEAVAEVLGSCRAIREYCVKIEPGRKPLVDTCGTGGDYSGSFNISTVSAFVTAGAGAVVAKHGNRSVSSSSGSADLLEALGINISLAPGQVLECIERTGIGFLYAPLLHPAMANAAPARKALGIRTIFNILGPLNNPAGVTSQVIGVYDEHLMQIMAEVLMLQEIDHALLVSGEDGMDELTNTGPTRIVEVRRGKRFAYKVCPEDFGLPRVQPRALKSRSAQHSAEICLQVLSGARGPHRDVVLLNSAAALYVAGIAENLHQGMSQAEASIDEGEALAKLRFLQDYSRANPLVQQGGVAYA